jgi:hemin uptake protein HemP
MHAPPPSDAADKTTPAEPGAVRVIDVRNLLGDGREVVLMHLGEAYRLRITARDRLILTK